MVRMSPGYQLKARVKGFEGKCAIVETNDQQVLRWPIKNLPDEIQEGEEVTLEVLTTRLEKETQEQLARDVLNSILR